MRGKDILDRLPPGYVVKVLIPKTGRRAGKKLFALYDPKGKQLTERTSRLSDIAAYLDAREARIAARKRSPATSMPEARKRELFLQALASGKHEVDEISQATGLSPSVIRRLGAALADEGAITAKKMKRSQPQRGYAASMFGGAGVTVREYWYYDLPPATNPIGVGEWWIDDGGTAMFADSDIGDAGHVYYAFEALLAEHGVDLEDPNVPEIIPMEGLSKEAFKYLRDEVGVDKEVLEFLMAAKDPREWALQHKGWIRIAGRNIQLWKLDSETVDRLSQGLYEAWDLDGPEEAPDADDEIIIEELSTGRLYLVPAAVIFDPRLTVAKIRKAART